MRNADNDNDDETPLPFQSLGAITARVLKKAEHQDQRRGDDRETEQRSERAEETRGEYVEQRLREVATFERRARGEVPWHRRRKWDR